MFRINISMLYEPLLSLPKLPDNLIQILLDDFEFNRPRLVPTKDNFEKFKCDIKI